MRRDLARKGYSVPGMSPLQDLKKSLYVAYELEYQPQLAAVHYVFNILCLKKNVDGLASIVPLESVDVMDSFTYEGAN